MTIVAMNNILGAYNDLLKQMPGLAYIDGESEYESALEFIESLMELIGDNPDDPRWGLIEISSKAVQEYEAKNYPEFEDILNNKTSPNAVVRVLMDQYQLAASDFPEIGNKEIVLEIVNEKRELSLTQVKGLCERFKIEPSLFFQRKLHF